MVSYSKEADQGKSDSVDSEPALELPTATSDV